SHEIDVENSTKDTIEKVQLITMNASFQDIDNNYYRNEKDSFTLDNDRPRKTNDDKAKFLKLNLNLKRIADVLEKLKSVCYGIMKNKEEKW
ncbi:MAG: hypothetical protein ACOCP8_06760, partial [archaeon]